MALQQTTLKVNSGERISPSTSPRDLVMAWAIDSLTGEPRYILQLDAAHRGAKSNCKCPNCGLPLVAVNAAKSTWRKRPHFRHPDGTEREQCVIVAARMALESAFKNQQQIILPRRRRSRNVEGLSGQYFNAWVEREPESIRLTGCKFRDEVTAFLTLNDGRRLIVQLSGSGEISNLAGEESLLARIEINVDDPTIAGMSPAEIFSRLELAWSEACWLRHWNDDELDQQAEEKARWNAAEALDWIDDADLPTHLSASERRETLLHREVKSILEREKRIRLPTLEVEGKWRRQDGLLDKKTRFLPEIELKLDSVRLEVNLGRAVPDVLAEWIEWGGISHTLLIEVTVTNPISDERRERISLFGWPALEIDIGRMGGIVTREEFTRLVVDEIAGKRWLYHPSQKEIRNQLIEEMKLEAERVSAHRQHLIYLEEARPTEWAQRYLDAIHRRWAEKLKVGKKEHSEAQLEAERVISDSIDALKLHGYAEASDMESRPLRIIIARIESIRSGNCIEYKYENVWGVINAIQCDQAVNSRWHTYYLIALRIYQPHLTHTQEEKVMAWRNKVKRSIESGETIYLRNTRYDQLLGLLFPELRSALKRPFGTISNQTRHTKATKIQPTSDSFLHDPFLRGPDFEEWARRNPDAANKWLETEVGKRTHKK